MKISIRNCASNSRVNAAKCKAVLKKAFERSGKYFPNVKNSRARRIDVFQVVRRVDRTAPHHLNCGGKFDWPGTSERVAHVPFEAAHRRCIAKDRADRP